MTDITINYHGTNWGSTSKGQMTIHLEEFLSAMSISKFKKLMKMVSEWGDGSEVQKILNIIEQFNDEYEINQKLNVNKIVGYTDKVKFTDRQVQNLVYNKSKFKKCSDGWNHYNEQVKEQREELRHLKAYLSATNNDFSKNERYKKFYDKCLTVIQG